MARTRKASAQNDGKTYAKLGTNSPCGVLHVPVEGGSQVELRQNLAAWLPTERYEELRDQYGLVEADQPADDSGSDEDAPAE